MSLSSLFSQCGVVVTVTASPLPEWSVIPGLSLAAAVTLCAASSRRHQFTMSFRFPPQINLFLVFVAIVVVVFIGRPVDSRRKKNDQSEAETAGRPMGDRGRRSHGGGNTFLVSLFRQFGNASVNETVVNE